MYRGRLDLLDSVVLLGFYFMYMFLLLKMPPEEFVKDRQQAALEVIGSGFLIGQDLVLTCAHIRPYRLQDIRLHGVYPRDRPLQPVNRNPPLLYIDISTLE